MALVELERFDDRIFADLVRTRLAADGIDAHVFDAGLANLGLGPIFPARLMVDEADLDRARSILDDPEAQ